MKTEEDEAFEAIERRQGGFHAKRNAAADKLQEPAQEPDALTIVYQSGFYDGKKAAQRPWLGLTDEETSGFTSREMTVVKYVSKVLQEKNT